MSPDHDGAAMLDPSSHGRWLVTTQGTRHVFDLNMSTYTRLPGDSREAMPGDGRTLQITRVERWPAVGGTFFLWLDDPHDPLIEYWRRSSTIRSIRPLADRDVDALLDDRDRLRPGTC